MLGRVAGDSQVKTRRFRVEVVATMLAAADGGCPMPSSHSADRVASSPSFAHQFVV